MIADRYDALFVDLDGVVYRGDRAVPGAPQVFARLRLRTRVLFITNNSARTPDQVAARLGRFGVRATAADVLTSATATAAMLRQANASGQTAFVIGERGIRQALQEVGVRVLDGEPDRCDLVVVGWDRSVDYAKLRTAGLLVQRGARLVATNADPSYPAPDGLWPGAGALLAALTTATGAVPAIVGKPHRPLFEAAAEATGATRPLVVGDRLDTDVAGAAGMGWDSLLVLTGAATPGHLVRSAVLPTYVGRDVSALLQDVPPLRVRPATSGDLPSVRSLLDAAGLSTAGLADRLAGTVVWTAASGEGSGPRADAGPPEAVVATACLERHDGEGLLRSVAVREDLRGRGMGILLVAAALHGALRAGAGPRGPGPRRVWLFTRAAVPFFSRLGFRPVDRAQVPEAVAWSPQAGDECGQDAVPLVLEL
jgi:HAD superfamily hydrolase (TIGR01457 family)